MLARRNLLIMLALDAFLVALCFYFSFLIRFDFNIRDIYWFILVRLWPAVIAVKLLSFWIFGLYRGMWRYTSLLELVNVLKAVFISQMFILAAVLMIYHFKNLPRSVFIIDGVLTILAVAGIRVAVRVYFSRGTGMRLIAGLARLERPEDRRLLIVGAGDAGEKVLREIHANPDLRLHAVGFLDDHPASKGKFIHGVPVLGPIDSVHSLPVNYDEILIAIPSARGEEMRRIVHICEETGQPFRTIPAIGELIDGKVSLKAVRNVTVEDLLGRDEVRLNADEIARYLKDRRVLVTGAGGSIGSELVRQIGRFQPRAVGLVDMSELNLFRVVMEFKQRFRGLEVETYLADIRDRRAVDRFYGDFAPEVVFHAAAYKHVPMQEVFPWEAVVNNVQGTLNVVEAAAEARVERFVLVSTDKAVRPTNVMGATKRVAELFVECAAADGHTKFMAVRFGNVMGSSGSAIPIFREQIMRGGPVTVTHADVTRYFMSVGEAAQLILQAGAIGQGGEVFILEMGRPIKILDLVRDMIRLHGYEPDKDIPIEFVGLRPGEKMYEELITEGEGIVATGREKILVLKGPACNLGEFKSAIEELIEVAATYDALAIRAKLKELVPEYNPQNSGE
jgi:FlaA1/EpsC-like NDP-sugar epimerase